MDRMQGSMGTLSAMQLTADTSGLDAECKALLHRKEVVSIILKGTVEEYEGYSMEEIMGFIEADSMEEAKEVSAGRTNAQLRGDNAEFAQLNESIFLRSAVPGEESSAFRRGNAAGRQHAG